MILPNFTPFPELQGERIVLRKMTEEDAPSLLQIRADADTMRYINRPLMSTVTEALMLLRKVIDAVENNEGITWALCLKTNRVLIGTFGYWRIDKEHHRAEIGYLLHKDFQRHGLMQEAMELGLAYAFGPMNLHSVEAHVNPENISSIRLLEKNGFMREAYFKENFYQEGRFLDSAVYSLLSPS